MKRLILVAMVAAALAVAPKAEAAAINGGFSIVGGAFTAYDGPGYTNPSATINTSMVLDFGSNGAATGTWVPTNCNGDFALILAPCAFAPAGTIKDLDITSGTGTYNISSFMTGANGLVIDLNTITLIDKAIAGQLTLQGFGTVIANGYTITGIFWNYTANSAGQTFSWSSSQNSLGAVPEPGSMVLLGTGLLGLAAVARRRLANKKA